jgi:hypothetical protein
MPTTYAIPDGRTVMAATLYTGNATARTISNSANGVSFQPDLVWIKMRSAGSYLNHHLVDSVRGDGKVLYSNLTNAEDNLGSTAIYTTSTGFGLSAGVGVNENSQTLVGWQWNAGGTTVTNTSGTISAQVRANTTAGFSVVTFTGTGSAATVGHGLGVAPQMVIAKTRNAVNDWFVYTQARGATKTLYLNLTNAEATTSAVWNNTAPTSTVFTVGTTFSTNTCVAYCFAPVAGYSAFGSYTGNGSTDGPFVYTGFRPRYLLWKNASGANGWEIKDTARDTYNAAIIRLNADSSSSESTLGTGTAVDILSNGFKLRDSTGGTNGSGNTYIYAAFAENPFKYANAR